MGIEGQTQLLGVGGRDGGDEVGGHDGALHQVDVLVVAQHPLVEIAAVQANDVLQYLVAVAALILDVVDGEHRLGVGQLGDVVPLLQHVDRDQGGLPVVAVDDVRGPAEVARRLDDGPGEVGKALTVIKVAVQLPAFEVILIVHEPVGDAVLLQGEDTAVHVPPRQSDVVILLELHLAAPLFSDPLIQR